MRTPLLAMLAVAVAGLAIAVWLASLSGGGRNTGEIGGAPPPPPVTTVADAACPQGRSAVAVRDLPTGLESVVTGTALDRFRVSWTWEDRADGEMCYIIEVVLLGEVHRVLLPADATGYADPREYDAGAAVSLKVFPVWPNRRGRPTTGSITVRVPGGDADLRCLHEGPELLAAPTNARVQQGLLAWAPATGDLDCYVVTVTGGSSRDRELVVLAAAVLQFDRSGDTRFGCAGSGVTYEVQSATVDGRQSPAVRVAAPPAPCAD